MKSLSRYSQPYQLYHLQGLAVDKVDKVYNPSHRGALMYYR